MLGAIVAIFVIAYAAIALEHPIRINKSASALIGAGLLWTVYAVLSGDQALIDKQLNESVSSTAQIVFFLIGAMTIVEVIDAHNGFEVITSLIRTRKQVTLMWLVGFVTFFLSAILDNLTTTIVMISLMRKLLADPGDRLFFAAMIVIAANAGGAWSAIGDVTTTMLWIGGQITPACDHQGRIPRLADQPRRPAACRELPAEGPGDRCPANCRRARSPKPAVRAQPDFLSRARHPGHGPGFQDRDAFAPVHGHPVRSGHPLAVGELIHRDKQEDEKKHLTLVHALTRIDMSSIVFFIGILLAVAALEHTHVLEMLAKWLDAKVGRLDVIVVLLGLLSAVVDNVPLVAASMGMYSLTQYPPDSFLWEFVAYCAGTGGSILIIGSAVRRGGDGHRKDRVLLVCPAYQRLGPAGLFWRGRRLHRAVRTASLMKDVLFASALLRNCLELDCAHGKEDRWLCPSFQSGRFHARTQQGDGRNFAGGLNGYLARRS